MSKGTLTPIEKDLEERDMLKYFKLRQERKRIAKLRQKLAQEPRVSLSDLLYGYDWVLKTELAKQFNPIYASYPIAMFYKATQLLDNLHKFPHWIINNKDVATSYLPGLVNHTDLWNWFTDQGKVLDHQAYLELVVDGLSKWVPVDEDAKLCRANDHSYYERKSIPLREDLSELLETLLQLEEQHGTR